MQVQQLQTFSRDCSKGFGSRVGKSSSELPLGFVRILTATVVSFHFAKYTFPKDPSPICFCICICSKLTCTQQPSLDILERIESTSVQA